MKTGLSRLKEVELKTAKHARVDKDAAKRFVKSGLWQPGEENAMSLFKNLFFFTKGPLLQFQAKTARSGGGTKSPPRERRRESEQSDE